MKQHIASVIFAFSFMSCAHANEAALYAPEVPADATLVRTINLGSDDSEKVLVDGKKFQSSSEDVVSQYRIVNAGTHKVTWSDGSKEVKFEPASYYTVVTFGDGTVKLFNDEKVDNPSKAMIMAYNLTSENIDIVAPDFNATIFSDIKPNASSEREINAVDFGIEIRSGSKLIKKIDSLGLRRQQAKSVIVLPDLGGQVRVAVQDNNIQP